jgi:hypothetical protein
MPESTHIVYDENLRDSEKRLLAAMETDLKAALSERRISGSLRWLAKVNSSNRTLLVLEQDDSSKPIVSYYTEGEVANPRRYDVLLSDLRSRSTIPDVLRRRMIGVGRRDGRSAEVTFPGGLWKLVVRRALPIVDERSQQIVKDEVTARDVEWFVPRWRTLDWRESSTLDDVVDFTTQADDLARLTAIDGDWEIELTGVTPEISVSAILDGWREFISQTTDPPYVNQLGG